MAVTMLAEISVVSTTVLTVTAVRCRWASLRS